MGRIVTQVGAVGSLYWWLLVGGSAATLLGFVVSTACYRAACRRRSRGLETSSLMVGFVGVAGMVAALWGALKIVSDAPAGPPAAPAEFLLLGAAALAAGALLAGMIALERTARVPAELMSIVPVNPVPVVPILLAVVAAAALAVLALLGAFGVLHLSVVITVAWVFVGAGILVVAALVVIALVFTVAAIFGA
ncbi:hypothetical protein VSH64_07280 [Amycolatopsis rhabdoformis]|uniref:Uncharacterized protein n=1 Tax=Amycolatopsis rhabdoformis TaxID=1448059 RepID=A0ABZ1IBW0_9PSEU|nr:hypothetical protein [Amycolatopsis rhabdoformis]WSE31910.1 hypothetical protein VSH64_07280 [Amycolatopsis rhabdoformis]